MSLCVSLCLSGCLSLSFLAFSFLGRYSVQRILLLTPPLSSLCSQAVGDVEEMVAAQGDGEEEDELNRAAARMGAMDVGSDASNAGASDFAGVYACRSMRLGMCV